MICPVAYQLATICFMFAYNIKIIRKSQGLEDKKLMRDNIQALSDWSNDWSVQINPNKSAFLTFWNGSSTLYTMNDVEIVLNSSIQDLGIINTTDHDLSWSTHHRAIHHSQSL